MENFGDDAVGSILERVQDPNDRKSVSLVCKHWLRVEGLNRLSLRVLKPDLLSDFLPRFPNLLIFECSTLISNAHASFVGSTCPKLEVLNLSYEEPGDCVDESNETEHSNVMLDISDLGVLFLVKLCRNLSSVSLRRRSRVGTIGVMGLARFAENLTDLDLGGCQAITDGAIRVLKRATSLLALNLQGCRSITDAGLVALADGPLSKKLKKLVLAECNRITDAGIVHLQKMHYLEELNLANCGGRVTDTGGMAIAMIMTLKYLNFSGLIRISDFTLISIARCCQKLVKLDLMGCRLVTTCGIRAFAKHQPLDRLVVDVLSLEQLHQGPCDNFLCVYARRWDTLPWR